MHEAYPVKADRVLPASYRGESHQPLLWHSFVLSLSGEKQKEKKQREGERENVCKKSGTDILR